MAKKQISLWVDEDILGAFDEVAWERRLSRTALLVELMTGALPSKVWLSIPLQPHEEAAMASSDALVATVMAREPKPDKKALVVSELKAGLAAERGDCEHPKESRQKFSWGSKCGVCGSILK